jgi:hypothetical protein
MSVVVLSEANWTDERSELPGPLYWARDRPEIELISALGRPNSANTSDGLRDEGTKSPSIESFLGGVHAHANPEHKIRKRSRFTEVYC